MATIADAAVPSSDGKDGGAGRCAQASQESLLSTVTVEDGRARTDHEVRVLLATPGFGSIRPIEPNGTTFLAVGVKQ